MKNLSSCTLRAFYALILCLFINACEKVEQPIRLNINQFKQTGYTSNGPSLVLSAQMGSSIGSDTWNPLYEQIVGFNYEPGYVYELLVTETEITYPQGSGKAYQLKEIISKRKVNQSIPFTLDLKLPNVNYIKGDVNNGFKILEEVTIDCDNLCNEMALALADDSKKLSGKFILNADGSIKLMELLN